MSSIWLKKNLGFESVFAIKTNHAGLPKEQVETLMEDFPSGSHVLLKGKCEGCVLYFLGYKYNCRKVLCFLCSENSGDFKEGLPYVARFHDTNGNMQNREVYRPSIISDYFGFSNKIVRHNHIR